MKATTILFAFFLLMVGGCGETTERSLDSILQIGKWKITFFFEQEENKTALFKEFTFTFEENHRVIAEKPKETLSGSWSTVKDEKHTDLDLKFSGELEKISQLWHVERYFADRLEMRVLARDGTPTIMVLEKI